MGDAAGDVLLNLGALLAGGPGPDRRRPPSRPPPSRPPPSRPPPSRPPRPAPRRPADDFEGRRRRPWPPAAAAVAGAVAIAAAAFAAGVLVGFGIAARIVAAERRSQVAQAAAPWRPRASIGAAADDAAGPWWPAAAADPPLLGAAGGLAADALGIAAIGGDGAALGRNGSAVAASRAWTAAGGLVRRARAAAEWRLGLPGSKGAGGGEEVKAASGDGARQVRVGDPRGAATSRIGAAVRRFARAAKVFLGEHAPEIAAVVLAAERAHQRRCARVSAGGELAAAPRRPRRAGRPWGERGLPGE